MSEKKYCFKFAFIVIALFLFMNPSIMHAQTKHNKIEFENHTEDIVSVKVIGINFQSDNLTIKRSSKQAVLNGTGTIFLTQTLAEEENKSIYVEPGQYHILIRYGSQTEEYHYAKGDTFSILNNIHPKFSFIRILFTKDAWIEECIVQKQGYKPFLVEVIRGEHYSIYPISSRKFENAIDSKEALTNSQKQVGIKKFILTGILQNEYGSPMVGKIIYG